MKEFVVDGLGLFDYDMNLYIKIYKEFFKEHSKQLNDFTKPPLEWFILGYKAATDISVGDEHELENVYKGWVETQEVVYIKQSFEAGYLYGVSKQS